MGERARRDRATPPSDLQTALFQLLQQYAPDGHISVEYALATPRGVKAPYVVWMSPDRRAEMRDTGDPSTMAPELCIEVMSTSNTKEEMQEKRNLYQEYPLDLDDEICGIPA